MSLSGSSPGPTLIFCRDLRNAFHNFVEDSFFDEEPRARAAALAVIEEDGAGGAGNGGVEIGVVEYDVRRFAAQFERDFFQIAGRRVHDQLADFGRAGERDFVDIWMRGKRGAGCFAVAGDDVDDAVRECPLPESIRRAAAR